MYIVLEINMPTLYMYNNKRSDKQTSEQIYYTPMYIVGSKFQLYILY